MIKEAEEAAKANNVKHISRITLEVGEVSTIVKHYFEECFTWAKEKNEYTKGCDLNYITIKAFSYCNNCNQTFETVKNGKTCPHCASTDTYLYIGNDVSIKSIETEEES